MKAPNSPWRHVKNIFVGEKKDAEVWRHPIGIVVIMDIELSDGKYHLSASMRGAKRCSDRQMRIVRDAFGMRFAVEDNLEEFSHNERRDYVRHLWL